MFKKLLTVALFTILASACSTPAPDTEAALDLADRTQRDSYAQGFVLGSQGRDMPISKEAFVDGVRDGLLDTGKLTEEEVQMALMDLQGLLAEASAAEGEENLRVGAEFLAENAARDGVQVTASGLQYEVIELGDGPTPQATDTVTVNYRGTLLDGTEFDSSYSRNEPATFSLQGVIAGWTEGLQLMPVGTKCKLYVPGDLAYGPNVRPGAPFGPNETLVFEIELLGIADR